MKHVLAALTLALCPLPAAAQNADRLIDISKPEVVVKAMQDAGYKAVLKTDENGDPSISSAANGSPFTVDFFNCKPATGCTSMQFFSWYKREPYFSVEMTNKWNAGKRFLKIAIDKDGDLSTYMDITATGKTTQANFADLIDWWSVMTSDLFNFMDEEEKAAKPAN